MKFRPGAVHDLYSTDPVQEVLDRADYAAPTQKHELDHADQESICFEISRS